MHQASDITELRLYLAQGREKSQTGYNLNPNEIETLLNCIDIATLLASKGPDGIVMKAAREAILIKRQQP